MNIQQAPAFSVTFFAVEKGNSPQAKSCDNSIVIYILHAFGVQEKRESRGALPRTPRQGCFLGNPLFFYNLFDTTIIQIFRQLPNCNTFILLVLFHLYFTPSLHAFGMSKKRECRGRCPEPLAKDVSLEILFFLWKTSLLFFPILQLTNIDFVKLL